MDRMKPFERQGRLDAIAIVYGTQYAVLDIDDMDDVQRFEARLEARGVYLPHFRSSRGKQYFLRLHKRFMPDAVKPLGKFGDPW